MTRTRSRIGVTMPIVNQPIHKFPEFAKLAEDAGFDSVWDYEVHRNPLVMLALCAMTTSRIKLGTGIAAACARTPNAMANAAADVDEISKGRAILGLSTGGADWAECLNGADIDHPVGRMREYISVMRSLWHYHHTGDAFTHSGEFYRAKVPPINVFGRREHLARPKVPVYLAGLKPKMLQLAGEIADGVMGYLYTPKLIREHVVPNVTIGARKAGRDPTEVDIASLIICSVDKDREQAMRLARINVGMYVLYPVAASIVEFMGLQDERAALMQVLMNEGPAALATATPDSLLRAFAICGTPEEALEQLAEFEDVLPHIILHTPYVPPIRQEESEAAFRNLLQVFRR